MRNIFKLFTILLVVSSPAWAQTTDHPGTPSAQLLVNVLCFKGTVADSQRVDVYTSIPYEALQFVKNRTRYAAHYSLMITVRNKQGDKITSVYEKHQVQEAMYSISRGSNGKTDISQATMALVAGEYVFDVLLNDELSGREYRNSRSINVPDFNTTPMSMSSLLFVSAIEQRNDRYRITPYIADNVSPLSDGVFVFFEVYGSSTAPDSADVRCDIYDSTTRVFSGALQRMSVKGQRTQQYLKLRLPNELAAGMYTLRTVLLSTKRSSSDNDDLLTLSERPLIVEHSIGGVVLKDIDKSIRQLRYIATQVEIDSISAPSTQSERRQRFEAYWKTQDPSPGTLRNEAFEEYYARIEYADKNFHSYNDGWLTDMGMIYIILGPPTTSERRTNTTDGRNYVVWTYAMQSRRFVFIDYSSFGDFRLSSTTPFSALEKYRYSTH